jgi:hypothetical protein
MVFDVQLGKETKSHNLETILEVPRTKYCLKSCFYIYFQKGSTRCFESYQIYFLLLFEKIID